MFADYSQIGQKNKLEKDFSYALSEFLQLLSDFLVLFLKAPP
jgi:hypothetical protein